MCGAGSPITMTNGERFYGSFEEIRNSGIQNTAVPSSGQFKRAKISPGNLICRPCSVAKPRDWLLCMAASIHAAAASFGILRWQQ